MRLYKYRGKDRSALAEQGFGKAAAVKAL